jgi:hypothetical protein
MDIEKIENNNNTIYTKTNWRPVIFFYVRTTSWIILPLLIAIIFSKKISPELYFLFVILGFGITCFGIYKEIKQYKKYLTEDDKEKNK